MLSFRCIRYSFWNSTWKTKNKPRVRGVLTYSTAPSSYNINGPSYIYACLPWSQPIRNTERLHRKISLISIYPGILFKELRLILTGERFFRISKKKFGLIGDIYQYTEAFRHYLVCIFVKFSRSQKIKFVKFHIFGGKNQENLKIWAKKMWRLWKKALR